MAAPTIKYLPSDPVMGVPAFSASGTFATASGVYPPVQFGAVQEFMDGQTGSTQAGAAVGVFCQGSNVASAGQFVQIINNSAVLLTAGNSGSLYPVGIAGAPMTATNVYGWVGVQGKFDNGAFTNVAFTIPGSCYLPAGTAGQIQSSGASNGYLELRGIVIPNSFTSADGSATSLAGAYCALTVQLNNPSLVGRGATNAAW